MFGFGSSKPAQPATIAPPDEGAIKRASAWEGATNWGKKGTLVGAIAGTAALVAGGVLAANVIGTGADAALKIPVLGKLGGGFLALKGGSEAWNHINTVGGPQAIWDATKVVVKAVAPTAAALVGGGAVLGGVTGFVTGGLNGLGNAGANFKKAMAQFSWMQNQQKAVEQGYQQTHVNLGNQIAEAEKQRQTLLGAQNYYGGYMGGGQLTPPTTPIPTNLPPGGFGRGGGMQNS